jgi:hypothetical protein
MKKKLLGKVTIGVAAALAVATAAPAHAHGNHSSLNAAVQQVYNQVQSRCTPNLPPKFQRIEWTGHHDGNLGQGRIVDANPRLGGPFSYMWSLNPASPGVGYHMEPAQPEGYWAIRLDFC